VKAIETAGFIRVAAVLVALGLLAACGFQLRGVGGSTVPDEWKLMHLDTGDPNSEFTRAVIGQFAANGVQWSDAEDANYSVLLGPERFSQSNLSLNAEARVSEIELTMSASFEVRDAATREEVMPSTTVSVVKQMESNPRNVVGKEGEMRLIRDEMRYELADQIMRRIGFHAAYLRKQPANSQPASP
jgi:LPS-assembly lipoprotein